MNFINHPNSHVTVFHSPIHKIVRNNSQQTVFSTISQLPRENNNQLNSVSQFLQPSIINNNNNQQFHQILNPKSKPIIQLQHSPLNQDSQAIFNVPTKPAEQSRSTHSLDRKEKQSLRDIIDQQKLQLAAKDVIANGISLQPSSKNEVQDSKPDSANTTTNPNTILLNADSVSQPTKVGEVQRLNKDPDNQQGELINPTQKVVNVPNQSVIETRGRTIDIKQGIIQNQLSKPGQQFCNWYQQRRNYHSTSNSITRISPSKSYNNIPKLIIQTNPQQQIVQIAPCMSARSNSQVYRPTSPIYIQQNHPIQQLLQPQYKLQPKLPILISHSVTNSPLRNDFNLNNHSFVHLSPSPSPMKKKIITNSTQRIKSRIIRPSQPVSPARQSRVVIEAGHYKNKSVQINTVFSNQRQNVFLQPPQPQFLQASTKIYSPSKQLIQPLAMNAPVLHSFSPTKIIQRHTLSTPPRVQQTLPTIIVTGDYKGDGNNSSNSQIISRLNNQIQQITSVINASRQNQAILASRINQMNQILPQNSTHQTTGYIMSIEKPIPTLTVQESLIFSNEKVRKTELSASLDQQNLIKTPFKQECQKQTIPTTNLTSLFDQVNNQQNNGIEINFNNTTPTKQIMQQQPHHQQQLQQENQSSQMKNLSADKRQQTQDSTNKINSETSVQSISPSKYANPISQSQTGKQGEISNTPQKCQLQQQTAQQQQPALQQPTTQQKLQLNQQASQLQSQQLDSSKVKPTQNNIQQNTVKQPQSLLQPQQIQNQSTLSQNQQKPLQQQQQQQLLQQQQSQDITSSQQPPQKQLNQQQQAQAQPQQKQLAQPQLQQKQLPIPQQQQKSNLQPQQQAQTQPQSKPQEQKNQQQQQNSSNQIKVNTVQPNKQQPQTIPQQNQQSQIKDTKPVSTQSINQQQQLQQPQQKQPIKNQSIQQQNQIPKSATSSQQNSNNNVDTTKVATTQSQGPNQQPTEQQLKPPVNQQAQLTSNTDANLPKQQATTQKEIQEKPASQMQQQQHSRQSSASQEKPPQKQPQQQQQSQAQIQQQQQYHSRQSSTSQEKKLVESQKEIPSPTQKQLIRQQTQQTNVSPNIDKGSPATSNQQAQSNTPDLQKSIQQKQASTSTTPTLQQQQSKDKITPHHSSKPSSESPPKGSSQQQKTRIQQDNNVQQQNSQQQQQQSPKIFNNIEESPIKKVQNQQIPLYLQENNLIYSSSNQIIQSLEPGNSINQLQPQSQPLSNLSSDISQIPKYNFMQVVSNTTSQLISSQEYEQTNLYAIKRDNQPPQQQNQGEGPITEDDFYQNNQISFTPKNFSDYSPKQLNINLYKKSSPHNSLTKISSANSVSSQKIMLAKQKSQLMEELNDPNSPLKQAGDLLEVLQKKLKNPQTQQQLQEIRRGSTSPVHKRDLQMGEIPVINLYDQQERAHDNHNKKQIRLYSQQRSQSSIDGEKRGKNSTKSGNSENQRSYYQIHKKVNYKQNYEQPVAKVWNEFQPIEEVSEGASLRRYSSDEFFDKSRKTPNKKSSVQASPERILEVDEDNMNYERRRIAKSSPPRVSKQETEERKQLLLQKIQSIDFEIEKLQENYNLSSSNIQQEEENDNGQIPQIRLSQQGQSSTMQDNKENQESLQKEGKRSNSQRQQNNGQHSSRSRGSKETQQLLSPPNEELIQKFKKKVDQKINDELDKEDYQHRGIYLYERAMLNQHKNKHVNKLYKEKSEQNLIEPCTFSPKTNKQKRKIDNFFERNRKWEQKKNNKIKEKKIELQEKEEKECVFRPKSPVNSPQSQSVLVSNTNTYNRQMEWIEKVNTKKQQKQQELYDKMFIKKNFVNKVPKHCQSRELQESRQSRPRLQRAYMHNKNSASSKNNVCLSYQDSVVLKEIKNFDSNLKIDLDELAQFQNEEIENGSQIGKEMSEVYQIFHSLQQAIQNKTLNSAFQSKQQEVEPYQEDEISVNNFEEFDQTPPQKQQPQELDLQQQLQQQKLKLQQQQQQIQQENYKQFSHEFEEQQESPQQQEDYQINEQDSKNIKQLELKYTDLLSKAGEITQQVEMAMARLQQN